MDGDKNVQATFALQSFAVEVSVVGEGQVLRSKAPPYTLDDFVELEAFPHSGWRFAGWEGDLTGTTNPQTV